MPICEYCGNEFFAGDGAWDDGDYMCGDCISKHIEESGQLDDPDSSEKAPATPPKRPRT